MRPIRASGTLLLLLAAGCGGKDSAAPGPCEGGGPTALEVNGWSDDPTATLTQVGGLWGLDLSLQASGLDATAPWTVVVRIPWTGAGTEDYLASVQPTCSEVDGIAPVAVRADLPAEHQADPAALTGPGLAVTAVLTDAGGRSADGTWTVTLELAP